MSLSHIAYRQIGREKQDGMSVTVRTCWYSKPAATTAASLMHVPPSLPGKTCEPTFSFHFRTWPKMSIAPTLRLPRGRSPVLGMAAQRMLRSSFEEAVGEAG